MATILLIRHGHNDTIGNTLAGRLPGVHLNEDGLEQARCLAEELADLPIKAVYASPLERTMETAEPIARVHALNVEEIPSLIEIDFGEWQGEKIKTLKESKLWKIIHEHPNHVSFPSGENFPDAQSRIIEGLLHLDSQYDENDIVVCVAHSDVIRLAVAYFLALPLKNFHRIKIFPASITVLHLDQGEVSFGPINYTPQLSLVT